MTRSDENMPCRQVLRWLNRCTTIDASTRTTRPRKFAIRAMCGFFRVHGIFIKAFSREVDTGSRDEDASKQKLEPRFCFNQNRKGLSACAHKSIAPVDLCFRAHYGLKSDIAGGPKSAMNGHSDSSRTSAEGSRHFPWPTRKKNFASMSLFPLGDV